ncbi:hypothetical protein BGY98DRAFT_989144 [Russula aff. rugulosa BPL654]|nr:hypothetical protein BGY98DRAFT_989144 [Russula aff. rugulosa BPL654]
MTRSWFLQVWGTNASLVCVLVQSLQRWARWALNIQFKDDLKIRDDGSNGCDGPLAGQAVRQEQNFDGSLISGSPSVSKPSAERAQVIVAHCQ